jgi:hypothetical protein
MRNSELSLSPEIVVKLHKDVQSTAKRASVMFGIGFINDMIKPNPPQQSLFSTLFLAEIGLTNPLYELNRKVYEKVELPVFERRNRLIYAIYPQEKVKKIGRQLTDGLGLLSAEQTGVADYFAQTVRRAMVDDVLTSWEQLLGVPPKSIEDMRREKKRKGLQEDDEIWYYATDLEDQYNLAPKRMHTWITAVRQAGNRIGELFAAPDLDPHAFLEERVGLAGGIITGRYPEAEDQNLYLVAPSYE